MAGARTVAASTQAGARLDLTARQHNAGQQATVLPPKTSVGFALGLPDSGRQCRHLRQFTVRLSGLAAPVTVPITGRDGGAAVCGDHAAVLTTFGGH
jgi:hypothetical protein